MTRISTARQTRKDFAYKAPVLEKVRARSEARRSGRVLAIEIPPRIKNDLGSDVVVGGVDQERRDTHPLPVDTTTPSRPMTRKAKAKRVVTAGGEIGQMMTDIQNGPVDLATTVGHVREHFYHLRQLVRQRVATINRARSVCRHAIVCAEKGAYAEVMTKRKEEMSKADERVFEDLQKKSDLLFKAIRAQEDHPASRYALGSVMPMMVIIEGLEKAEAVLEKEMTKLAKMLPTASWIKDQHGVSLLALAKIVGFAGDLNRFQKETGGAAVAKFWKFMEMGLVVEQGDTPVIQSRRASAFALIHNYAGWKRSLMWNVGGGLIGGMGNGVRPAVDEDWQARADWSPYQKLYVGRLIYEAVRDPEGMAREPTKEGKMRFSQHAHNRAKRYVEKRFLKLLYLQWRKETGRDHALDSGHEMPA